MTGTVVSLPINRDRVLSKKQLAALLGRTTRWVELRMREGLPSLERSDPLAPARFRVADVEAWLANDRPKVARSEPTVRELAVKVASLERELADLRRRIA